VGVKCQRYPLEEIVSIYISSAGAFANALYSNSMLDRDIVGCFFKLHESKLRLRKTRETIVRLLVEHLG
jgi:hypothetical protein